MVHEKGTRTSWTRDLEEGIRISRAKDASKRESKVQGQWHFDDGVRTLNADAI